MKTGILKGILSIVSVALLMTGAIMQNIGYAALGLAGAALTMDWRAGLAFTGIDVSALSTTLVKVGAPIIMKLVNMWTPSEDFGIAKNVKMPMPLTKLATVGAPRPYRAQQDLTGNGIAWSDRKLTVYQSKWDFNFDPEAYRNTYLAGIGPDFDPNKVSFPQFIAEKIGTDYLASINDNTLLDGVYNASGTGAVDLMDGLVEILTNAGLTPVVTGAVTSANAVTKVELLASAVHPSMRSKGFKIICSWTVFDYYKTHYRTMNPFGFEKTATGGVRLDGFNASLEPRSYMNTSLGMIALPATEKNIWIGTDGDGVRFEADKNLNTIDVRVMMPLGMQLADPDRVKITDQL